MESVTAVRRKTWKRGAIGIASLFVVGAPMLFLDQWGQRDRAQKADAIVVLGAHVRPGGLPSLALSGRTLRAVELYHEGFAPRLIATGGVGDNPPAESLVIRSLAVSRGVPIESIYTEETSTSTWENATNAAEICHAHGWKSVIVVSEPFHLWRACRNFQKFGLTAYPSAAPHRTWSERLYMTAREVVSVARDAFAGRL
jgi:uncharacterized SAM-binding protein YcdF (DUF218 family)